MKKAIYTLSLFTTLFVLGSCSKSANGSDITLAQQLIQDKTWYLDYSIISSSTSTKTKTYVGQSTYFVNYLANGITKDSDGINGTYTVEKIDNQLQIHVQAKTNNASSVEFIYNIESVGAKNLVLSYQLNNQLSKLYYSAR